MCGCRSIFSTVGTFFSGRQPSAQPCERLVPPPRLMPQRERSATIPQPGLEITVSEVELRRNQAGRY